MAIQSIGMALAPFLPSIASATGAGATGASLGAGLGSLGSFPVSYTHLTLPTKRNV